MEKVKSNQIKNLVQKIEPEFCFSNTQFILSERILLKYFAVVRCKICLFVNKVKDFFTPG